MTAAASGEAVGVHLADLVLPMTPDLVDARIADGGVAVGADGHLVDVGTRSELLARHPGVRIREHRGVMTPGLVNAHAHLEYSDFADLATSGLPFADWIREVTARRKAFSPTQWLESARRGALLLLRSGTTTVADVVTHGPGVRAAAMLGLHGLAFLESVGVDHNGHAAELARMESWLDDASSQHPVGVSPHAPYSLGTGLLRDLGALGRRRGLRLHVHAAESRHEVDLVRDGSGPFASGGPNGLSLELAGQGVGRTPVGYLDDLGLLGPDCHLAHGVHVDADDRALLRDRGTAVALCPRSNALLGAGEAPVAAYLREGNAIAVGTDSLASTPDLELLSDVAAARDLARAQGYEADDLERRLMTAVTVDGAAALGLDGRCGVLAAGARADVAVFDVPLTGDPWQALVDHGAGRCVATVLGGRLVSRGAHVAGARA